MIRISKDGGETWRAERSMGGSVTNGNVVLDETTCDILFLNPGSEGEGKMMRSSDHGQTWVEEDIHLRPDGFGLYPHSVGSMQAGVTLEFGEHTGRLIMPGRIMGPAGSNDVQWRPYHYSTALYSDDGGETWQTSRPFPVLGTGEAALAELSDGRIMNFYAAPILEEPTRLYFAMYGHDLSIGAKQQGRVIDHSPHIRICFHKSGRNIDALRPGDSPKQL